MIWCIIIKMQLAWDTTKAPYGAFVVSFTTSLVRDVVILRIFEMCLNRTVDEASLFNNWYFNNILIVDESTTILEIEI